MSEEKPEFDMTLVQASIRADLKWLVHKASGTFGLSALETLRLVINAALDSILPSSVDTKAPVEKKKRVKK